MTNNVTPDDVEYVPVTSIDVGDILVRNFHTLRQHVSEAPTLNQLRTRATLCRVYTIDSAATPQGWPLLEINIADPARRVTWLKDDTINTWRVKRAGV